MGGWGWGVGVYINSMWSHFQALASLLYAGKSIVPNIPSTQKTRQSVSVQRDRASRLAKK